MRSEDGFLTALEMTRKGRFLASLEMTKKDRFLTAFELTRIAQKGVMFEIVAAAPQQFQALLVMSACCHTERSEVSNFNRFLTVFKMTNGVR